MNWLLIKGIITGMILSIPFGPVGIFCMEKSLTEDRRHGMSAALGMLTSDQIYNFVILYLLGEIDIIREFIWHHYGAFKILIGVFLLTIGIFKIVNHNKKVQKIEVKESGYIKSYFTTLFLALINATNFLTVILIYSSLNLYRHYYDTYQMPYVLIGIFIGGFSVWYFVTLILSRYRMLISFDNLRKIKFAAGIAISIFACYFMLDGICRIFMHK